MIKLFMAILAVRIQIVVVFVLPVVWDVVGRAKTTVVSVMKLAHKNLPAKCFAGFLK